MPPTKRKTGEDEDQDQSGIVPAPTAEDSPDQQAKRPRRAAAIRADVGMADCGGPAHDVRRLFATSCQLQNNTVSCEGATCTPSPVETLPEIGHVGEQVVIDYLLREGILGLNFSDDAVSAIKTRGDNGIDLFACDTTGENVIFFEIKSTTTDHPPPLSRAERDAEDFVATRLASVIDKGADHPYYAAASTADTWRNTEPDKCDYLKVNVYLPQEPGEDAPIAIEIQDWRTGELRTERFEVIQDSTAYRYETSTQRGAKGEHQLEKCLRKLNFTDITNIKYEGEHGLDLAARSPDGTVCFFESKTTCRDGEPTLSEEQRRPEAYVTSRLRRAREYAADEAQQDAIDGFLAEALPLYLKSDFYVPPVNTTDWPHIEIYPWEDRR